MNRHSLPISEVIVQNRQRTELGDIDDLANSLSTYGLIQPIVINQDKRLIAGGRRYAAATKLGWTHIDVVYRETMSEDELHELELEENLKRKDMTWQEQACNIKTIHDLKAKRAALEGISWGYDQTAQMLGINGKSNVWYPCRVAPLILAGDKEIIACENLSEALKLLLRRKEDAMLASLNHVPQGVPETFLTDFAKDVITEPSSSPVELLNEKDAALEQYLKNPLNDPNKFEEYYQERIELRSKLEQHRITIPLSKMIYCCDSIEFMSHPDCCEKFDAIITDIPYGIDMNMLNQGNDGHAFKDIDTVLDEHTVEGNEALFAKFFPAAYHCLKPNTFLITWADQMQWQLMYDIAERADFKVQRWPITWVKTHPCMNQSANTNFTKTTEIAMVCRKGTCTLSRPNIPTHILAGRDELCETLGHPFAKPFQVWEHLISAVTLENQLVLEPFAGRGSGIISLQRMNRSYIGCELNVPHFNALIENLKQHYLSINPNLLFT